MPEAGSDLAAAIWSSPHAAASSLLAFPEARAALAAARRAGRLSRPGHRDASTGFETVWAELSVVGIDMEVASHAGELADRHGLRGYDAVHLASALVLGHETTVVTWDLDLSRAAQEEGLAVAPAPDALGSA